MNTIEVSLRKRKIPKWVVPVFGYGISAISLVWVFSKFPFAQLGHHLRTLDWRWVALAIVTEVLVYFADAWRWMVLLSPVGAPSFASCLQGVFVGLLANDILPARAGELIRCFLLSYKTKVHLSLAITSDLIERIMDGVWIVLIYLASTFSVSSHRAVDDVMWLFGSGVVVISLLILWVLFHRQHAHHFVNNRSWGARFVQLFEEIHSLGHWRELGLAFAIGAVYWSLQATAVWAICRADKFHFDVSQIAFLLVVKTVYTVVPSAPASVGLYQWSAAYALMSIQTEKGPAEVMAEIMFVFLTLPLILGGAIAIASAGFKLDDLHRHAHDAHTRRLPKKEE